MEWVSPNLTTVTEDNVSLMLSAGKVTSSTSTMITDSTKAYAVNSLVNRKLKWLTGAIMLDWNLISKVILQLPITVANIINNERLAIVVNGDNYLF